jgi:nucleoside-diphosphate-sugar epimerase
MRVVVTGASGFIGGHIARGLAADGHAVVALGRRRDHPCPGITEYCQWDLTQPPPPLPMADAVIHAAAEVADWGPWATFQAATIDGTRRVLEAYPQARVIVIGSASVYDPFIPHLGAREAEAPVGRYRNAYAVAKAVQERITRTTRPDALILRPHAVYGPNDRTLLLRLLAARRFGRMPLPGGGRQPMSITSVDAVVDAVRAGLENSDVNGPCNIADGVPVSPRQLLDALFRRLGLPTAFVDVPLGVAWPLAITLEYAARFARSSHALQLSTYALSHLAWPFVLDVSRAQVELGVNLCRSYLDRLDAIVSPISSQPAPRLGVAEQAE